MQGQPERTHLISRAYGYHGTHGFGTEPRGHGAAARQGAGPLVPAVSHVDLRRRRRRSRTRSSAVGPGNVAAFFCEPVIGAGGVRPAPHGYIEAVGGDLPRATACCW